MAASRKNDSVNPGHGAANAARRCWSSRCVGTIMIIMALGGDRFSRAIYDMEVLTNLSRTGSNLALRADFLNGLGCGGGYADRLL